MAETDVTVYAIEKDKFLAFIEDTEYTEIMNRLADIRDSEVWETLSGSSIYTVFHRDPAYHA
jgi:hypothetical protein